jgi:hypothetical protein
MNTINSFYKNISQFNTASQNPKNYQNLLNQSSFLNQKTALNNFAQINNQTLGNIQNSHALINTKTDPFSYTADPSHGVLNTPTHQSSLLQEALSNIYNMIQTVMSTVLHTFTQILTTFSQQDPLSEVNVRDGTTQKPLIQPEAGSTCSVESPSLISAQPSNTHNLNSSKAVKNDTLNGTPELQKNEGSWLTTILDGFKSITSVVLNDGVKDASSGIKDFLKKALDSGKKFFSEYGTDIIEKFIPPKFKLLFNFGKNLLKKVF